MEKINTPTAYQVYEIMSDVRHKEQEELEKQKLEESQDSAFWFRLAKPALVEGILTEARRGCSVYGVTSIDLLSTHLKIVRDHFEPLGYTVTYQESNNNLIISWGEPTNR